MITNFQESQVVVPLRPPEFPGGHPVAGAMMMQGSSCCLVIGEKESVNMSDVTIVAVKAREVLDSKARPMVEVDVWTSDGVMGRGSSPCGTSVGRHEAVVLRDGGTRYGGLGVRQAVRNVQEVIFPAIKGESVLDQRRLDDRMIELDGTPNKARIGANATYSTSVAVARAAAASVRQPLFRYLGGDDARCLPVPMFNVVNGGNYGTVRMEIQEFLLIPVAAESYAEAQRMGVESFTAIGKIIERRYGNGNVGSGGYAGHAAPTREPREILDCMLEAVREAGYEGKCRLGLDCAASHFFDSQRGLYGFQGRDATREDLIRYFEALSDSYNLLLIEDPLEEDDFEGFAEITRLVSGHVIGDDFFVNNLERLKRGVTVRAANGMVLKPNMVGTISEALAAARYAAAHNYVLVGSCRAGGTVDDPIPEVSVAAGATFVKLGAPRTGERVNLQNCLLRVEEELGENALFAGSRVANLKPGLPNPF
jgi:enolase